MVSKKRKAIPKKVETEVLLRSRRRCSVCFGISGDLDEKQGQIAHLDHNPSNNDPDNLAFLCLAHHDEYDSRRSQSKGLTAEEVKRFRMDLAQAVTDWPTHVEGTEKYKGKNKQRRTPIELEAFDRRLAIYRIVREFIRCVVSSGEAELDAIRKFAAETEEALFLFDERVSHYIDEIYHHAVEFRAVSRRLNSLGDRGASEESLKPLLDKDTELIKWFTAQFGESRRIFREYIYL